MNTRIAVLGRDIADRLDIEFADRLPRNRIVSLVESCLKDLQGIPAPALPELAERLARQRLLDLIEGPKCAVPGPLP
jgi:hypothetical protein